MKAMLIFYLITDIVLMFCIVSVARYLNKKINDLDEAVYQYMKEEHNAKVESNE